MNKKILYTALALISTIIFNFAVTNMAALYILGDLGGSAMTGSYSLAYFGFGNCLGVPLGKILGLKYGRKKVLTVCLVFYVLTTFTIGFSSTYPIFIIMRFLQGYVSGPMLVLIASLLTKLANIEERRKFIRSITILIITVSVIAASIGGTLAYLWYWAWSFYGFTLIIAVIGITLLYLLRDISYPPEPIEFDIIGYISLFIGVLATCSFITLAYELDYLRSPLLQILLPLGIVSLAYFIIHSWNHPSPVISFKLLKNPTLAVGLLVLSILFSAYFGMVFLISQYLHLYANYTPLYITIVLGTMAVTALAVMLLVDRIYAKTRLLTLMIGITFFALSCFYSSTFNVEIDFGRIALARICAGIGLALILPPLLLLVLSSCDESEGIDGLTLFQFTRTIASGLGGPIYSTIWMRREVFYHSRLGSRLTLLSEQTSEYLHKFNPFHLTPEQRISEMNVALARQSNSLALNDTFYSMGLILIGTIALILIYRLLIKPRLRPHLTI
ncbi:MAG: Fatty acid resistance protein FarB [Chlamydiia bacterium]|nr:Fatty acid resistance protein FarB [Chlamydiia bacterium]MCH9615455.1 Fatty acid resistance protein FarB [Chlamydiia bacterium]MCH9629110.1 Fatty acid resistance protein FarB [Chlamydiia bacterium]